MPPCPAAVTPTAVAHAAAVTPAAAGTLGNDARAAVRPESREASARSGCGGGLRSRVAAEQHGSGQGSGTDCTGGRIADRSL